MSSPSGTVLQGTSESSTRRAGPSAPQPLRHPVERGKVVESRVRGVFKVVSFDGHRYRLQPITGRRLIESDLNGEEWSDVSARYR